jgi:hypothetical protein
MCHGKYGSAPLSGVTDPYNRSLYIGHFVPTNLQLMAERQTAFHLRDRMIVSGVRPWKVGPWLDGVVVVVLFRGEAAIFGGGG